MKNCTLVVKFPSIDVKCILLSETKIVAVYTMHLRQLAKV